jgi:hypothetical protein
MPSRQTGIRIACRGLAALIDIFGTEAVGQKIMAWSMEHGKPNQNFKKQTTLSVIFIY